MKPDDVAMPVLLWYGRDWIIEPTVEEIRAGQS